MFGGYPPAAATRLPVCRVALLGIFDEEGLGGRWICMAFAGVHFEPGPAGEFLRIEALPDRDLDARRGRVELDLVGVRAVRSGSDRVRVAAGGAVDQPAVPRPAS